MAFDREQFQDLIERVLREIDAHSASAVNLLLGTAAVESRFGTYLRQVEGPALGVFQMEPATEEDIWAKFLINRKPLRDRVINATGQIGPNVRALESNIAYQIAMARCHYLRFKEPLSFAKDIEAMADYWKRYYNTTEGKGSPEEFIANYKRFVGMKS